MYYNPKEGPKKTKAGFSRLLRYPAWKRRWPILVLVLHKSLLHLLALTHLQRRDPHITHHCSLSSPHSPSTSCQCHCHSHVTVIFTSLPWLSSSSSVVHSTTIIVDFVDSVTDIRTKNSKRHVSAYLPYTMNYNYAFSALTLLEGHPACKN